MMNFLNHYDTKGGLLWGLSPFLRDYAKYVLREGSNEEKRELMGCFKSKISVTGKVVTLSR